MSSSFSNNSLRSPVSLLKALTKQSAGNTSSSRLHIMPGPGSYETSSTFISKTEADEIKILKGGSMGSQHRFKYSEKQPIDGNYDLLACDKPKPRFPKVTSIRKNEFLFTPGLLDSPGPMYDVNSGADLAKENEQRKKETLKKLRRRKRQMKRKITFKDDEESEEDEEKQRDMLFFLKKGKVDIYKQPVRRSSGPKLLPLAAEERETSEIRKQKTVKKVQSQSITPGPDHYFLPSCLNISRSDDKRRRNLTFGTSSKTDFTNKSLGENLGPGRYNVQESSLSTKGTILMPDYFDERTKASKLSPGPGSYYNQSLDLSNSKAGPKINPVSIHDLIKKGYIVKADRKPGPGSYSSNYQLAFPMLKPHAKSIKEKDKFRDFYEFKHHEEEGKTVAFGSTDERRFL